jgi:hypothetical protein
MESYVKYGPSFICKREFGHCGPLPEGQDILGRH